MKTKQVNARTLVTVKRPCGTIEKVEHQNVMLSSIKQYQQEAIKQTRAAGRGEILSFERICDEVPMSLEEERKELIFERASKIDRWYSARERDFGRDIGFIESRKLQAAMEKAEKAVEDFDLAHPEIIAAIKKAKSDAADRWVEAGN